MPSRKDIGAMEMNGNPLSVEDILSVYSSVDRSHQSPTYHVVIQLLTADGVLVLKTPQSLARNLADELLRAAEHRSAAWVPGYRATAGIEDAP